MFHFSRLGPALRFLREQRGLTQKGVAAAADITAPMLSSYENQRGLPEIETLDRILHLGLGATLDELAHALAVVNDRVRAPAAGRERARETMPPAAGGDLAAVLAQIPGVEPGEPLPPALEAGYAQIVNGLITVSRHVVETLAESARQERSRSRARLRR